MSLVPECLDDFVAEDNPARVVDAFVSELDLRAMGFDRLTPASTGRPSYHPAVLLKIYIYGYLNRIQSSRRLERECQRDLELMWLTGRLAPVFKTIAEFRRNSGKGTQNASRRFVVLCRELKLFSQPIVSIDGSKFKTVNNRDRNFTEVTNDSCDRSQLSAMDLAARDVMGKQKLQAHADRGYYSSRELKACDDAGIAASVPKSMTSGAKADARFDKSEFIYIARDDQYQCPAGQRAICRFTCEEAALQTRRYWSSAWVPAEPVGKTRVL